MHRLRASGLRGDRTRALVCGVRPARAFVGLDQHGIGKERSQSYGAFGTFDLNLGFQRGMAEK